MPQRKAARPKGAAVRRAGGRKRWSQFTEDASSTRLIKARGRSAQRGSPWGSPAPAPNKMTVDVPTQLRELAEVGSLSFQRSADSPIRTEFPKLAARLLAKREAHDAAIQSFAEKLTVISDGIEVDVKTASDGVVDALDEVDQRTAAIFDELNKDELLVTKDASYLTETWEAIEQTLKDRHCDPRLWGAARRIRTEPRQRRRVGNCGIWWIRSGSLLNPQEKLKESWRATRSS